MIDGRQTLLCAGLVAASGCCATNTLVNDAASSSSTGRSTTTAATAATSVASGTTGATTSSGTTMGTTTGTTSGVSSASSTGTTSTVAASTSGAMRTFVCRPKGTTSSTSSTTGSSEACTPSSVGLGGGNAFMTAAADLNHDGLIDLVVAENGPSDAQVFLGLDGGGFVDAGILTTTAGDSSGIALGDVNGDGELDLIAGDYINGSVSVLLGRGDGTFGAFVPFAAPGYDAEVILADFNRDGHLDVATSAAQLLLGDGDGGLQPAAMLAGLSCDRWQCPLAAADVDGDGNPDLVFGDYGDISVLRGLGDGTFQAVQKSGAALYAYSIAVGDFNCDGKPDVAFSENENAAGFSDVNVMLGNGDGTFGAAAQVFQSATMAGSASVTSVSTADVNGDGVLDLVFTLGTGLYVYLGDGSGGFAAAPLIASGPLTPDAGDDLDGVTLTAVGTGASSPLLYVTASESSTPALALYAGSCW